MSVMDGRRPRVTKVATGGYARRQSLFDVEAFPVSFYASLVPLGQVERITVSTDSKIAGTRLRRRGKGRTAWRALPPHTERRGAANQLQGTYDHRWRLEYRGQDFDTRREAVEALVDWCDHPEKRER